jgi:hypothetical protein
MLIVSVLWLLRLLLAFQSFPSPLSDPPPERGALGLMMVACKPAMTKPCCYWQTQAALGMPFASRSS